MSDETNKTVDITALLKSSAGKQSTARVEFKEGVFFKLRYISKSRMQHLMEQAQYFKYDKKLKTRVPAVDSLKFFRSLIEECIEGWEGMTLKSLAALTLVNIPEGADMNTEIPYSSQAMEALLDQVYDLDGFINEIVTDASYFTGSSRNMEEELGN